ncbi:MAG: DUF2752 domain-containing protein [Fimbriimonadaceae bacterium]|nr:DUF2752 domain-containing protein [Fimbriimonadaceae bacterium]
MIARLVRQSPGPRPPRRLERLALLALALLATGGLLWLAGHPPQDYGLLSCSFHALSGYYCPGCGAGRATYALLHGRLDLAWACHPLLLVALPWLALLAWRLGRELWTGQPDRPFRWRHWPALTVGLILTIWLARNLPWWPCTLLTPPSFAEFHSRLAQP